MYRMLVCGGRDFEEEAFVMNALDRISVERGYPEMVFTGGAKGADDLGTLWALRLKIKERSFPADWKTFGKSAGIRRNETMLALLCAFPEYKPLVVAFPGGVGTQHMIDISRAKGVEVIVIDKPGLPE